MATCKKPMTYEEKELAILREAVDKAEERSGRKAVEAPQMKQMINILEGFLRRKKLVCYGGTAINNILPLDSQFYNREVEIPDYDFFSPSAMTDAKELADIYAREGFSDVGQGWSTSWNIQGVCQLRSYRGHHIPDAFFVQGDQSRRNYCERHQICPSQLPSNGHVSRAVKA